MIVLSALLFVPALVLGQGETDLTLQVAETLFRAMKDQSHQEVWACLTARSQQTIVNEIYKSTGKLGGATSKEQIATDMAKGGATAQTYWKAFLENFDPDSVLEQSTWKLGAVRKDKAEIMLLHKGSENPAVLKLFKEGGTWKVGLVETFWAGK